MDNSKTSGEISRRELAAMTNKERFHEGSRIPVQLRRICWELWSPLVSSADEPDDWQMLEVLDWYVTKKGLARVANVPVSPGKPFVNAWFATLLALSLGLLLSPFGGFALMRFQFDSMEWSITELLVYALLMLMTLVCIASIWLSGKLREELRQRLAATEISALVSTVVGSRAADYDLVRLPDLRRGQGSRHDCVDARMLADNIDLFIGMDAARSRQRLRTERAMAIVRGFALGTGVLMFVATVAALPLVLGCYLMADGSNIFTNRRHELLLAMLDEMYVDEPANEKSGG